MSSPGHLNISSQDGTSNILGELPLPRTYRDDGAEHVRILTVSHCGLSSLTASPNSRLALVLPFITTFQAPHNKLRRLTGLDAMPSLELLNLSHNELHQMDRHSCQLLKALPHIRVVDLSHNKLQLMELGATLQHHHGDPNNTAGGSGGLQRAAAGYVEAEDCALHITSLNLSHNVLVEVPDLRCLPSLQILNLDYNRIEHLTDLDQRLPLLSIHTLQLRRNRIRHVSSLVPLAAMAESLHHVQLYGNPFTMEAGQHHHQHHHQQQQHRQSSSSVMGGAKAWWWRPVLLWLAPLLNTLDLVEFTYSEHTAAINHLFRERGAISLKLLELLNAQQKDELEKYLRKMSERVSAPADLPDIIQAIEEEDELESGEEDDAAGDVLEEEDDDDDDDHHQQQQQHPMTSTSTPERVMEEEEGEPAPPSAEMLRIPLSAHINNASLANMNAGGTYSSAISPDPIGPGRESPQLPTPTTTTATATATLGRGDAALAQVVRAMQQKVKSLSGVVETLWREDVVRRSFAAVVIQRHMRGALARMHLPEETREMCGFIRHQLRLYNSPRYYASLMVMNTPPQQHHASAPPTPPPPAAAAVGASSSSSCAGAPASSGIVEVLATMKSLQNVISTMWADLDEFRIMSQREQERAARLIQRFYRGYAARKSWRMLKAGYDEFVASLVPYVCHIQRAGRGFVERRRLEREVRGPREVQRLRCEVMDLRAQLHEVQKVLMDKLGVHLSSSRLAKDINLNAPSAVMLPTDESTPSSARSTATH